MHYIYVKTLRHSTHHPCACLVSQTYTVKVIKKRTGTRNSDFLSGYLWMKSQSETHKGFGTLFAANALFLKLSKG